MRAEREKAREILGAGWPKAPNALSGQLKRAGPALRKIGIAIDWPSRHGEEKTITIANSAVEMQGRTSSHASQSSPREIISHDANMFAGDMVTLAFFSLVPILVPVAFLGLHLGVALVQTYIFVTLTMVYIGMAISEEH